MSFLPKIFASIITFTTLIACNRESSQPEEIPQPEPEAPTVSWDWTDGYPKGVSVETFSETFSDGKKCSGFIATVDFSANPNLRFNCIYSNKKKKPSEFFANFENFTKDEGIPCVITNAGYFAGSTSVSLLAHDGTFRASAPRTFNWPNDENCTHEIHPVRSAIGLMKDGKFEITWVYCTKPSSREHTAFPSALDNNEKTQTFLSDYPTADYCSGTYTWIPEEAVGGGPRLVKDGVNVAMENYWAECLDSGGTSGAYRVNRTAAGITEDGKLILLVADGRGSNGSAGYTLSELADKLISLGCTDALNLDGGGSTCMVGAGGEILNLPSDKTGERSVSTAIAISEIPHN